MSATRSPRGQPDDPPTGLGRSRRHIVGNGRIYQVKVCPGEDAAGPSGNRQALVFTDEASGIVSTLTLYGAVELRWLTSSDLDDLLRRVR